MEKLLPLKITHICINKHSLSIGTFLLLLYTDIELNPGDVGRHIDSKVFVDWSDYVCLS